jgi:hypothetical protein
MRLSQLLRALIAADLDRFAADFDLDGIHIQLAVASRTSFLNHDVVLQYPSPGRMSRPRQSRSSLSESLAIYREG